MNYTHNKRLYAFKLFYTVGVSHSGWPIASVSLSISNKSCFARLTSKASISQLVFGSPLIRLAQAELELQKLWPRFSQRKQWCQVFWTRCNITPLWGLRRAKSPAENLETEGVIINQNSLTLPHSSLTPASLSPHQPLGLSRPETAHFKAISDRPASCTSAENHKLFYWMKFLQSDELSVTDSRYTTSLLCVWKCASCQIFQKKNEDYFQGFWHLHIVPCAFVTLSPNLCQ